jgi:hypothetical protein
MWASLTSVQTGGSIEGQPKVEAMRPADLRGNYEFDNTYFSREDRYAISIESISGRYYASIPVSNGIVDYEEYYELTARHYHQFLGDREVPSSSLKPAVGTSMTIYFCNNLAIIAGLPFEFPLACEKVEPPTTTRAGPKDPTTRAPARFVPRSPRAADWALACGSAGRSAARRRAPR